MLKVDSTVTVNGIRYLIKNEGLHMYRVVHCGPDNFETHLLPFASRKEAYDYIYTLTLQD